MTTEALAKALEDAAEAVINRWHSPDWKDVRHTADFINSLREALAAYRAVPESLGVPASPSGSSLKPFGHAAIPNAADGAPTLPAHPDARVFTWTASELRAIERYGQQCHEQGRQQGRAQAAASGQELDFPAFLAANGLATEDVWKFGAMRRCWEGGHAAGSAQAAARCAEICEGRAGSASMFATSRDARDHNHVVRGCAAAIREEFGATKGDA